MTIEISGWLFIILKIIFWIVVITLTVTLIYFCFKLVEYGLTKIITHLKMYKGMIKYFINIKDIDEWLKNKDNGNAIGN